MKVIKVGTSSQSRIAQACDRCRSKKIRCDGIRPCCSQCANVGFECRTSDKLSRRAFPRGYTESLEERVRALESEVRELKDLLDEKDEKIDMLSKMHSNRRSPAESPHRSPPPTSVRLESSPPPREDTFRVQASPLLLGVENSDSYFMGASSGRSFIGLSPSLSRLAFLPCFANMPSRIMQEEDAGEWQVVCRFQSRSVFAHPGVLSSRTKTTIAADEGSSTVVHRPLRQCLLPGVVAPFPGPPQADFSSRLRGVCGGPG